MLAYSPDGRRVALVVSPPEGGVLVRLWDLRTGRVLGEADTPGSGRTRFATFSPNGNSFAAVDDPRRLGGLAFSMRVWDVAADGKLTNARDLEPDARYRGATIHHASFSPDGKLVAAGTADEEVVYVWEVESGRLLRRFQGGVTAHFGPDGRTLIAVTHDGEVRRFDTATWKFLGPVPPFKRSDYILVSRILLAPDGKRMALGDEWTTLIKDVETNRTLCRLNLPGWSYPLSFSRDGKTLAVAAEQGTHFFDTTTGAERAWLSDEDGPAHFLGDGRRLACFVGKTITLRETTPVFEQREKASTPARTDPPGVALEATLVARQKTYALDLEGDTVEDFSTRIQFGEDVPEPPRVDLLLKLRNTGKENITLHDPVGMLILYLIGPGALNRPWESKQLGVGGVGGVPNHVTLSPDETHTRLITSLTGEGFAYWLLPGEYLIGGEYFGRVSPPPPGADISGDGSGWVTVRFAPAKVTVVPGKHVPDPGPPAAKYEIRRPPPPGTVIVPKPADGSTIPREMLSTPARWRLDEPTPLTDALKALNIRFDLDLRLDEAAFRTAGKPGVGRAKVEYPDLDVSFHTLMQVLLDQIDGRLEIRGGTIWILPAVKPQCLAERLYRAPRHFKEQFDEPVTREGVKGKKPLSEVLQLLEDEFELTFLLDTRSFERTGVKDIAKRPVRFTAWNNVRLGDVVEDVLRQAGATFVLRDRGLVVVIPVPK